MNTTTRNIDKPRLAALADMWEILKQYTSWREKVLLLSLAAILIGSASFTIVGFINRNTELTPQAGGTYTEAAVGQPRHINPILAGSNDLDADISNLVFSSLFTLSSDLELQGDLAQGYTISEDGLIYTVTLRDGITWHDGEPFTSEDVVFTIRSIQTPDYDSPLENSFQGVAIEAPAPNTVVFTLKQPYAPFLNNLTVGIVPKHVWEQIPPVNAALAEQMLKPIGTGPFRFAEIVTRRKTGEITTMRLTRNEDYYGARPYLDEFILTFFATPEEALAALTSNNADGVSFLPQSQVSSIESRGSLEVRSMILPQYFALFLNPIANPRLSDAGIRAALALATNRQDIINEALNGQAVTLNAPIPPGLFTFEGEVDGPSYNPDVARQNLEEAGWKDEDSDGIREKDGERLEIVITTTDWPEYVRTAEIIQQQWGEIGIGVTIQNFGAGAIQQTIVGPRDYEVLLYGEVLSSDPDPYPFWHSTQTRNPGLNLSLLRDQEIDRLLEEARKTLNYDERRQKYIEFQQRFLDLNPAIILYQPYYLFAQQDDVRGFGMTHGNLPVSRLNDIENWHVNVKRVWKNSDQT